MKKSNRKLIPYVCGPLTDLTPAIQADVKRFYSLIGDICEEVIGARAFVPHEHFDPILHATFTPAQVDESEFTQVSKNTSILIIVAIGPSWGGGIEVGWIRPLSTPALLLIPQGTRVSRLVLGSPNITATCSYASEQAALDWLRDTLPPCIRLL